MRTLAPHEVDLWIWCIEDTATPVAENWSCLSPDEVERANRFLQRKHTHAFVHARSLLRQTLAEYVADAADAIRFEIGSHGKPSLAGVADIQFNLSHTKGAVALAISAVDVGVDIETRDRATDVDSVASRYFRPDEWLPELDLPERRLRFFDLWALKEAYMKARGLGMALSLKSFGFPPSDSAEFVPSLDAEGDERSWVFQRARLLPSYHVGLCAQSEEIHVSFPGEQRLVLASLEGP